MHLRRVCRRRAVGGLIEHRFDAPALPLSPPAQWQFARAPGRSHGPIRHRRERRRARHESPPLPATSPMLIAFVLATLVLAVTPATDARPAAPSATSATRWARRS